MQRKGNDGRKSTSFYTKYSRIAGLLILSTLLNQSSDDFVICIDLEQYAEQHQLSSMPQVLPNQENRVSPPETCTSLNYLLARTMGPTLNKSDPVDRKLDELLKRDGIDMRPSRDFKDYKDIGLDVAKRAWVLMNTRTHSMVKQQISSMEHLFKEVLTSANVSSSCQRSIAQLVDGIKRFDSWAVRLVNSWGSLPPSGVFDGIYTDRGSYHECLSVRDNPFIDHSHFCYLQFRPVIPSLERFASLFRKENPEFINSLKRTSKKNVSTPSSDNETARYMKGALEDVIEHSNYFHYVHLKVGSCWPIGCSPFDIKRVAKLLGYRNILMNGPIKCYSDNPDDYEEAGSIEIASSQNQTNPNGTTLTRWKKLEMSTWDVNDGIFIAKPYVYRTQMIALILLLSFLSFVGLMTLIDLFKNYLPEMIENVRLMLSDSSTRDINQDLQQPQLSKGFKGSNLDIREAANIDLHNLPGNNNVPTLNNNNNDPNQTSNNIGRDSNHHRSLGGGKLDLSPRHGSIECSGLVGDFSLIRSTSQFFRIDERSIKKDVVCLYGIRCITMSWIILAHTLMYNDWTAFGRIHEIENSLKSLANQPIFYASYLVDTFFLMSGVVTAFSCFKCCIKSGRKFVPTSFIISRWLRLTPPMMFVAGLYIVTPLLSSGPDWYPIVGEFSDNCVNNWWINLFQVQAFFKSDRMCNFTTWWISVDFYYHIIAIICILAFLKFNHFVGFATVFIAVLANVGMQTYTHYKMRFPPTLFSTIAQIDAMWGEMILEFFWAPMTHAVPYFFGFYTGYLLIVRDEFLNKHLTGRRIAIGWFLCVSSFFVQSYSSYFWLTEQITYSRIEATIYYDLAAIIWSLRMVWIIVTCHLGCGGFVNRLLSSKIFIILGRTSYMVYLSHFFVTFVFNGNQSLLIEPSFITLAYIIIGNIFMSTLFGVFLTIIVETPCQKLHKRLMDYLTRSN